MASELAVLNEIALDIRSSWNHAADELWEYIDPELWSLTNNPWIVLQTVSRDKLKHTLEDPLFRKKLDRVIQERRDTSERRRWFERTYPSAPVTAVAYFSMEFMLAESLPISSGGLGNVAGDQLKAANDLGVPTVGIGLLYATGYFRQHIDRAGNQIALRPFNDPGQLPITPVRNTEGEWLRIPLTLPGGTARIRTWRVQVGARVLYLLDANDPANLPEHRSITSELYGGGPEVRIEQERILGVGAGACSARLASIPRCVT
jgi:starch phosphorylase